MQPSSPTQLNSGSILDDRFLIDGTIGAGGMGAVFKAHDLRTDAVVAVKVMHRVLNDPKSAQRFRRESEALSTLHHPGIVGYVAHGVTAHGVAYLAMEWLEGEELRHAIARGPLAIADVMTILEHTAAALDAAHRVGLVHRDLKPSNLFLVGGKFNQLKLLDFGIARRVTRDASLTAAGVILGTPEYMAPEQARGQQDVAPSADVFSAACVAYECLTGRAPFAAAQLPAVLAKILFEEARPVQELRIDVPSALADLLARMLAKDERLRPRDGATLMEELQWVREAMEGRRTLTGSHKAPTASIEMQPITVILALAGTPGQPQATHPGDTMALSERGIELTLQDLTRHGARASFLADGSLVVGLLHRETVRDLASVAAHYALRLQRDWPDRHIALATGKGGMRAYVPFGAAVDRAADLIRRYGAGPWPDGAATTATPCPLLDDATAGLLDRRFRTAKVGPDAFRLLTEEAAERAPGIEADAATHLCVGRERELAALLSEFSECFEDGVSRVVVLRGAPGIGKTQLLHEFVARLRLRHEEVLQLHVSGTLTEHEVPYAVCVALLGRLVECAPMQLPDLFAPPLAGLPVQNDLRTALSVLCKLPLPPQQEARAMLLRQDTDDLARRASRGLASFLRARAAQRATLITLDNLQWIDNESLRVLDAMMAELSDMSLLVLAVGRTAPQSSQPQPLWRRAHMNHDLGPLSRRACETLAAKLLAQVPEVDPTAPAFAVEYCEGNPLILRELVRAIADGKQSEVPESVLAILQARLMQIDAAERAVLRAASVYGETFWARGIRAILPVEQLSQDLNKLLHALEERDVIARNPSSRLRGDAEYRFRQKLLRDAAYGLLSPADQAAGHLAAAQYLESAGETDPTRLAPHFYQGGSAGRAAVYYAEAAQIAYQNYDLEGALLHSERGASCTTDTQLLQKLRSVRALVYFWHGQLDLAQRLAVEIAGQVEAGGELWYRAQMMRLLVAAIEAPWEAQLALMGQVAAATAAPVAIGAAVEAMAVAAVLCALQGEQSLNQMYVKQAWHTAEPLLAIDSDLRGCLHLCQCVTDLLYSTDAASPTLQGDAARSEFDQTGNLRGLVLAYVALGGSALSAGDLRGAEELLREAHSMAEGLGGGLLQNITDSLLARVLGGTGTPQQQQAALEIAHSLLSDSVPPLLRAYVRMALTRVHLAAAEYAAAESELQRASMVLGSRALDVLALHTLLLKLHLGEGRVDRAQRDAAVLRDTLRRCQYRGALAQHIQRLVGQVDGLSP